MSGQTEENKAIVRRIHRALDAQDLAGLDGHPAAGPFRAEYAALLAAFPDARIVGERLVAEGEWVAYHLEVRGTHRGAWAGVAPTGEEVTWVVDGMYRLADGLVVEGFGQADLGERLARLAGRLAPTGGI
jgi:predicted ester cyclase